MRIITGRARGLKLKTPTGLNTRPTSDRVKESVFNILNGLITFGEINAVLDIFAGTGALGLEALSRGAHSATFIDAITTEIIRDNVTRAKFLDESKIIRGDVTKILPRLSKQNQSFDLIFCDPPYAQGLAQISINLTAELNLLNINGLMIVEHGANEFLTDIPENFTQIRQINYGHTTAADIFTRK